MFAAVLEDVEGEVAGHLAAVVHTDAFGAIVEVVLGSIGARLDACQGAWLTAHSTRSGSRRSSNPTRTRPSRRDQPGQQSILDRWLDLALITTLRAWFDRLQTRAPGWYRAQHDPVVGHTLRLIHDDPAYPWSVQTLADATGVSRATLYANSQASWANPR